MSIHELHVYNVGYLIEFILVAFLTRATARRITGAFAGGAVLTLLAILVIVTCEKIGWWHVPLVWEPYYMTLMCIDFLLPCIPLCLLLWRGTRRFGRRGLAASVVFLAVIGPPRDYQTAILHPKWMVFAAGVAPILADSAFYASMGIIGYAVMTWVAGPPQQDNLARRPWDARAPQK